MALIPEIKHNTLFVKSVGDHELQDGFEQMGIALDMAKKEFEKTNVKLHMFIDLIESAESREPGEMRQIIIYLQNQLDYLSGKIAIYVQSDLYYGLARAFEAYGEMNGIEAKPSFKLEELYQWLGIEEQSKDAI